MTGGARSAWTAGQGTRLAASLALLLLGALPAAADDLETQAWANYTMGWVRGEKLYLELDLEPKVLVSGEPQWRNVDVTPMVEYYPSPWVDLTGEVTAGTTMQTDDLRTNELTFRAGLRLYLIKNMRERFDHDHKLPGRVSVATLFRVEERNFSYSDDTESQHEVRFRARLGAQGAHQPRPAHGRPDVLPPRRRRGLRAGRRRGRGAVRDQGPARVGLGYRIDERHRVDLLYFLDRVRDTIEDTPTDSAQMLDLRYRVVF